MGIISFIEKVCVQTAVYWGNPTPDGYGGFVYDDPVEIACRWEDVRDVVKGDNGREIQIRSKVLVTQDLDLQGYLYLGSLDDSIMDSTTLPEDVDAYQIIWKETTPLFKSTDEFVYMVYLHSK